MKRLALSSAIIFIFVFFFEWAFHGMLLRPFYEASAELWREQEAMKTYFMWMLAGQLLFTIMFCAIYLKLQPNPSITSGAFYGLLVGLLMSSTSVIFYSVMPLPLGLLASWIAGAILETVIAGTLLGAIAKSKS